MKIRKKMRQSLPRPIGHPRDNQEVHEKSGGEYCMFCDRCLVWDFLIVFENILINFLKLFQFWFYLFLFFYYLFFLRTRGRYENLWSFRKMLSRHCTSARPPGSSWIIPKLKRTKWEPDWGFNELSLRAVSRLFRDSRSELEGNLNVFAWQSVFNGVISASYRNGY